MKVDCEIPGLNLGTAVETLYLECLRGWGNSWWSSEIRRDQEEHRRRRRLPGGALTLIVRKRGDQTGLDTLVVRAVNDGY